MHCGGQCHQVLSVKVDGHKGVQALPHSRQPEALPGHSPQLKLLWQINAPARHVRQGRRQAAEAMQTQSFICRPRGQTACCGSWLPSASKQTSIMCKTAREHRSSGAAPPSRVRVMRLNWEGQQAPCFAVLKTPVKLPNLPALTHAGKSGILTAHQSLGRMQRDSKLSYPYLGFTRSWNKSLNSSTQSVSSTSCSINTASLLSCVECVWGALEKCITQQESPDWPDAEPESRLSDSLVPAWGRLTQCVYTLGRLSCSLLVEVAEG